MGNEKKINGILAWETLKTYNDVSIEVARNLNIEYIDLANLLEKDSKYYWDFIHYSIEGNKKIAEIIFPKIQDILNKLISSKK